LIIVHHLEDSRSQRILWLLEELGAEYEIRRYERDPETQLAPKSLEAVHPLGKAPVIEDEGRVVAETGHIVDYLIDRFGSDAFRPAPATSAFQDYRFWLHYAEASLMTPLILRLVMDRINTAPMPFFVRPIAKAITGKVREGFIDPNMDRHFDFGDSSLEGRDFFAGDTLTGADIMMSFPVEAGASRANVLIGRPALRAWLDRIHARPAYGRALKAGGAYTYGPK